MDFIKIRISCEDALDFLRHGQTYFSGR